jgi:organic radical activating enzyme
MKFPWHKYTERPLSKRNTLQVFITNKCNLSCVGCFARNVMGHKEKHISLEEYEQVLVELVGKGGKQINIIGGEPMLHPQLLDIIALTKQYGLKITIYTNGYYLNRFTKDDLVDTKLRVSLYSLSKGTKSLQKLVVTKIPIEICFMVSSITTLTEMLNTAYVLEQDYNCNVFFISSLRELDNERQEFFYDTAMTMPVIDYKQLVHRFMTVYKGNMEIHVSKRGIFESTVTPGDYRCRFANYFIGGKIIQCPYDIVNEKYQNDYTFDNRHCQHNSTCLMSKVIYVPIKRA